MPKLKVVAGMPAYNEGKYVGSMVVATRQYVDEVIVVDDGSGDNTSEIARLAGASVFTHTDNKGYGAAVKDIFAAAREADADILVLLDADGQHNPADIPNLVKPIYEGCDFVTGTRKAQTDKIPFYRRVGQGVILRFINVLSRKRLSDSECGFRAFSRKALSVLDLKENGMAISAETVAEVSGHNLKVAEVPVSVAYNKDSSTLNPLSHGLGVITKIIVMISEQRPLFFFGLAGVILAVLGMVAGIITLRLYSASGVVSVGWTLVSIFLLIMGTLSFFTGLTLHTIATIIHNAISRERH